MAELLLLQMPLDRLAGVGEEVEEIEQLLALGGQIGVSEEGGQVAADPLCGDRLEELESSVESRSQHGHEPGEGRRDVSLIEKAALVRHQPHLSVAMDVEDKLLLTTSARGREERQGGEAASHLEGSCMQQAEDEGAHIVLEEAHEPLLIDRVANRARGVVPPLTQPGGELVSLIVGDEVEEALEERQVDIEHALSDLSGEQAADLI
jgi:hypothetical protein